MNKKSMLYIMGIDWEWIYQRPQIIADKLAGDFSVTVLFPRSITKCFRKRPRTEGKDYRILWTIPYQEKNKILYRLSRVINSGIWKDISQFDYVYVGYPLYGRYLPEDYPGKIIYDCMDNHEALYPDQKRVVRVLEQEKALVKRSDLLVVSAELLKQKMDAIAGNSESVLIRNGVQVKDICAVSCAGKKKRYSLCYIGTISEWFDFSLLEKSLSECPDLDYHLIGPAVKKREHDRITYHGPVSHEELGEAIRDYDCLIMPFRVNEIVSSVDPVKLYEYIAFGKCIISVFYPEIERFSDYVYFYRSEEEYIRLLQTLMAEGFPPKYDSTMQKEFLAKNTWDMRYQLLKEKIDDIG